MKRLLCCTSVLIGMVLSEAEAAQDNNIADKIHIPTVDEALKVEEDTMLVPVGTIGTATLALAGNSDYPGPFKAYLSRPIYSVDNKHVIFPEGSWITGFTERAKGTNEPIHNRLVYRPEKIVRPDGRSFNLKGSYGLDHEGIAAIKDMVEYHTDTQAKALAGYTVLNTLPEIIQKLITGNTTTVAAGTFIEGAQSRGQAIIDKYLALVPTVTVRAGKTFLLFFSEEQNYPAWKALRRIEFTNVTMEEDYQ